MCKGLIQHATHTSLSPIRHGFAPGFVNYKMGALDSQPQVIKFTSYLPIVGGYEALTQTMMNVFIVDSIFLFHPYIYITCLGCLPYSNCAYKIMQY
jgi:hypothetical protein